MQTFCYARKCNHIEIPNKNTCTKKNTRNLTWFDKLLTSTDEMRDIQLTKR